MLNDVLRYILLYAAFLGFVIQPIPFLPYPGTIAFLIARFNLPVVRADIDFFNEGALNPNFNIITSIYHNKLQDYY